MDMILADSALKGLRPDPAWDVSGVRDMVGGVIAVALVLCVGVIILGCVSLIPGLISNNQMERAFSWKRLLAAMLVEHLSAGSPDPLPAAREAGRHWGRRLAGDTGSHRSGVTGSGGTGSSGTGSSEAVAELLGDMGFEPEPVAGGIALRNCPFREIVDDNQPVVCAIHAGMLDGMLEQPPEGSTTRRGIALEPFAAPEGCLVRLDPQGYER